MRFVFIFSFLLFMVISAFGQSFDISIHDSTGKGTPGGSYELEVYVVNLTADQRTMLVTRTTNVLPDSDWSTSMCFGATCYPPSTDQVGGNIAPNDSSKFSITFNTSEQPGYGEALVVFEDYISGDKDTVLFSFSTISKPALELTALDTTAEGEAGGSYEVGGFVRNLTDSLLTVNVVRVQNNVPEGWSTSICFDICVSPEQDTVTSVINAGDSLAFTLTFNTDTTAGEGSARLMFYAWGPGDTLYQDLSVTTTPVGIVRQGNIPGSMRLLGNFPNPFNPETSINYELRNADFVELNVYNIQGQKIATLINNKQKAGAHTVSFNAAGLPSGTYIYRLKAGNEVRYGKMLLVK